MNGLQSLPQWQTFMNHPKGAWLGFINAVPSLAATLQYPLVAWAANRFGRKPTVSIAYFWLILGVALQTAATNEAMFVMGRFFVGCVTSWFSGAVPPLITETAYPSHRGVVTALYNCGWYVGSLLAAWVTFGTRNMESSWAWRVPSIVQAAIPLLAFTGWLICPESPRWLVSKGRDDEARAFFVKYHAEGDASSPLVDFEMEEVTRTIRIEEELHASTGYMDMFKTKGNRRRLFISVTLGIFAQWNGVGVVSYYLAGVLETAGITDVTMQTTINGCLQIFNLIAAVTAACIVDKVGRRPLFLVSCVGMLISYTVISGLSGSFANTGNKSTGIAVIPMLFLYYGSYDIAFTPLLFSYPVEIWQYSLRARGVVVTALFTNIAIFFNIFVNPIALGAIAWKYYIVFAVILVFITITVYFFYPETRGHSLEEIALIFDGEDALDNRALGVVDSGHDWSSETEKDKGGMQATHAEHAE